MGFVYNGEDGGVKNDNLYSKINHISFNATDTRMVNTGAIVEEGKNPIMEERMGFTAHNLCYQNNEQREANIANNLGGGGILVPGTYLTREELNIVLDVFYKAESRSSKFNGAVKL